MKSSLLPLHDAIYNRVKDNTDWTIFDHPGDRESCPYIAMGPLRASRWCDKLADGQEVFATLDFWSEHKGKSEALKMMDDALQAITASDLVLTGGFRAALETLDTNEIIVDIDGVTRHGILIFKFLIEET